MVTIPLTLLDLQGDGFHLLVEVVVLGQRYQAVVDTGASKTVFDHEIVQDLLIKQPEEKLTLELSDKLSTGLGTNTMKSYTCKIPELWVGDLCVPNLEIAVLDLSTINFAYRELDIKPVIGVIGGDILQGYHAVIRYDGPTLTLSKN